MRGWIKDYRSFKDKLTILDDRRLEFDAERRAFHKLELKKVRQQQATDKVEPELMGKLEAKSGDVAGTSALNYNSSLVLLQQTYSAISMSCLLLAVQLACHQC